MSEVVVYTTDRCSFCVRVKMLLRARDIEFEEINISGDPAAFVELTQTTGMTTLPQVMIGGELVGGYQETAAAERSGLLDKLLAAQAG
jgi:glutaredoxin 3